MPDISSIDDKIKKIESSHKLTRRLFVICIVLVVILGVILFHGHGYDNSEAKFVKIMQDSLKAHDEKALIKSRADHKAHDSLVAMVVDIQNDLSNTQADVAIISNKYDKVRKQLTSGSVDSRVKSLSDRLPKDNTTGR